MYDVFIFTGDRDLGDTRPYAGIQRNTWTLYDQRIKVYYSSPNNLNWKKIKTLIEQISPDFIYLNSMFSKYFSVYPLLMKRREKIASKVILAPRGMLKDSALSFKSFKKRLFLTLLRTIQVQKGICFQATDTTEVSDIKKYFGEDASVKYVPNFPGAQQAFLPVENKEVGSLKIIFVGRVHPIKSLDFLLRCLQQVKGKVVLTVVGSIEDIAYKKKCDELIRQLPSTITVTFTGDTPHHQLEELLLAHHLFCLPTQGENFGHAIFEALAAGRPVLVSDQTPWRGLAAAGAGWDLSLNDSSSFVAAIEIIAAMDSGELNKWCKRAWQYCHSYIEKSNIKEQYTKIFY